MMKYTLTFVLIALFAMISMSQAMPKLVEDAVASDDSVSAKSTVEIELSPEDIAKLEAISGRDWRKALMDAVRDATILRLK
uniref:Salivary secreted peptide n=1 Tax=Anopheles funestus TaxID=62324 RepID=A0A182RG88_ANOFN